MHFSRSIRITIGFVDKLDEGNDVSEQILFCTRMLLFSDIQYFPFMLVKRKNIMRKLLCNGYELLSSRNSWKIMRYES